jgi:exosome complex RNA-binding protein Rrp4
MPNPDFKITREEYAALNDQFRQIKHDINNTLAVVMALSELAQRNPTHYEKLSKAVLQRGPEVVHKLQDFQNAMGAKLKSNAAAPAEADSAT